MDGAFKSEDVSIINQSVRKKDRNWRFIKRNLKAECGRLGRKLKIVELGAGTGSLAILIGRTNVASKHICIDGSKEMLKFIEIEEIPEVEIMLENIEEINPISNVDIFLAKYIFHHIKDKKRLFDIISKSLKKEGKLIVIDKCPKWKHFSLFIEKFLDVIRIKPILGTHYYSSIAEFESLLSKYGLDIIKKELRAGKKLKNFHMNIVHYNISKK